MDNSDGDRFKTFLPSGLRISKSHVGLFTSF